MTPTVDVNWHALARPIPDWFLDAKLGIFVHWGPYSVPAWAPPAGEPGAIPDSDLFARNPYAEWYWNSMRIEGSPTARHHRRRYGSQPYDAFLDLWSAERFDPGGWVDLFMRAGARYIVPTTKHHDGVTLWDAPGTGSRNTVRRGPRRDLISDLVGPARRAGLRLGAYYSGGLDWHFRASAPIRSHVDVARSRPVDARYARYAFSHVSDLINRFAPDILWNDIDWPDAGKRDTPYGLSRLLADYRAAVPEGVVNDRWGVPVSDFRTFEYALPTEGEAGRAWEHCRGIGYSFGYNQAESRAISLDGHRAARLLADIASRGGNLLLNVGPRADGTIPRIQERCLRELGTWMASAGQAIHGTRPLADPSRHNGDDPWVRWTTSPTSLFALVDPGDSEVRLPSVPAEADARSATVSDAPMDLTPVGGGLAGRLPDGAASNGPAVIRFHRAGRKSITRV